MPRINTAHLSDSLPRWHDTQHDQADTYPFPQRSPLLPSEPPAGPESRPAVEMACHTADEPAGPAGARPSMREVGRQTQRALGLHRDLATALVVVALCLGAALVLPALWHATASWLGIGGTTP